MFVLVTTPGTLSILPWLLSDTLCCVLLEHLCQRECACVHGVETQLKAEAASLNQGQCK